MYYSIYESLPPGKLKTSMAELYGFEILPESFRVHPNYPNPFNPITTIDYEIPIRGDLLIQIYNLQGQQIVDYNAIDLSAGYYSYDWDASNYPSGIYLSRIYFNNLLYSSKKMVLIKYNYYLMR